MLKANEATAITKKAKEKEREESARVVADFCEQVIEPEIQKAAEIGKTTVPISLHQTGVYTQSIVNYLLDIGYEVVRNRQNECLEIFWAEE